MDTSFAPPIYACEEQVLFIEQLQEQLACIRKENDGFAKSSAELHTRIYKLEEEKISLSSGFNKETGSMRTTIAQLEAQLERGEAMRQSLEYELTLSKKKLQEMVRGNSQKETTLHKETIALRDEKAILEKKLLDAQKELELARRVTTENEKVIAVLVDEKDQLQLEVTASTALLKTDNDKLTAQVQELTHQNSQIRTSFQDMKRSLAKQDNEFQRARSDMQVTTERKNRIRHELDDALRKVHSLEETIEAERAAHLESKFNSEIIQLKHHESQNQLVKELETTEAMIAKAKASGLHIEKLEKKLHVETLQAQASQAKLEKTMQVFSDVRKGLDEDINQKSYTIAEMKEKLTQRDKLLTELSEELARAKQKQTILEESHESNIRELELLMETFCLDESQFIPSKGVGGGKIISEYAKGVLENLRKILFSYQKKINQLEQASSRAELKEQTQKDVDHYKNLATVAHSEIDHYKNLASTAEQSLQQAQAELQRSRKELEVIRLRQAEFERESGKANIDLKGVTSELRQQTENCRQLETNINAIQGRYNTEVELHVGFLRELHHLVCTASGEKSSLSRFTWSELSVALREGVNGLVSTFERSKAKTKQLENSCEETRQSVTELQREHSSAVSHLSEKVQEVDEEAARQRKQLENHYEALLTEMQTRIQKTQTLCDEAWERVRAKDEVHDGLQAECSQLRGENSNLKQDEKALSSACAMLLSALYPTLRARDDLVQQRTLLSKINNGGETFQKGMRGLVETLNREMNTPEKQGGPLFLMPSNFRSIHPLIRFRVAVICVLAARRLGSFTKQENVPMFTCNEAETPMSSNRIVVVAGTDKKKFKASNSRTNLLDELPVLSRSDATIQWLSNSHLVHGVRDATFGVVDAVAKHNGDTTGYLSKSVIKAAKNAFLNLLEATQPHFDSYESQARTNARERNCLCRLLAVGLEKIIQNKNLRDVVSLFSAEHSVVALQRHLLHFTDRLHDAEVEKRNLRNRTVSLKESIEHLRTYEARLDEKDVEMKKLKERERNVVPKTKFDSICCELDAALQREQLAQKLLHEQNHNLQSMSKHFEEKTASGVENEMSLAQAVTSLSEVNMELKRSTHANRHLEKQLDVTHQEKSTLQNQVDEAKRALKKAVSDKILIAKYFTTVEKSLVDTKDHEIINVLRERIDDMAKTGGLGMEAAQRAVEAFLRVQSSSLSRIEALESQLASYQTHISSLKRELHDVCQREKTNVPKVEFAKFTPSKTSSSSTPSIRSQMLMFSTPPAGTNEFHSLQGETVTESSFFDTANVNSRNRLNSEPTKDICCRKLASQATYHPAK